MISFTDSLFVSVQNLTRYDSQIHKKKLPLLDFSIVKATAPLVLAHNHGNA
jgi:hypothetical protein